MTTRVRQNDRARTLVGYCWPWTVRPGERIDFMVSCERGGRYRADLVRILCADGLSAPEMLKVEEISAPFSGDYQGRFQFTNLGSFVEIRNSAILDGLVSFTVQAMVYPTLLPNGVRKRSGGKPNSWQEPVFRDQYLVSRWDAHSCVGWSLFIDMQGRPTFMVSDGDQIHKAALECELIQDRWFLVLGSVDAKNGSIRIGVRPFTRAPGDLVAWPSRISEQRSATVPLKVPQAGPLRFAACNAASGAGERPTAMHCFNGRLDRVRISAGQLSLDDAVALSAAEIPMAWRSRAVGFWDFSKHIDGVEIADLSANALHGVSVNVPTRAVRGVDWDGSIDDWRIRPEHYSAIHFHDDDLYDAEWNADFSYLVPTDLLSGIYAARLRQDQSEDYIPFFVACPKRRPRAHAALLIPTMTYTAYSNVTALTTLVRRREIVRGGEKVLIDEDLHPDLLQSAADAAFLLEHHARLGKGLYSNHSDGTLACCASQRHPNMTTKPNGINWTLVSDTYLTDWLEQKGIRYDVITDDLLHEEGVEILTGYTVVLTGNHPEYYTERMLQAVEQYQKQGGRWMYLGGNGLYWVTSVHRQLPGLIEVRKDIYAGGWLQFENRHAFDGVRGGKWQNNGRSPALLVGLTYQSGTSYAMEGGASYRRLADSYQPDVAFIFRGVSNDIIGDYGIFGGGAAGQEVDKCDPEHGMPSHALHLARAGGFASYGSLVAEEYKANTGPPIADLLFFETPGGGAVFSVGSMSWTGALSHNGYDNDVSRITENVLRRFMDKEPFPMQRLKSAL